MCLATKRNWRVLCWNVRGLNANDRQRSVRAKIEECSCDIVCLQETKCDSVDWRFIHKFAPKRFDNFTFSPSVGASGGMIVLLSWFRQQICHRGRDMAVCGKG
jgi:exonuclease III